MRYTQLLLFPIILVGFIFGYYLFLNFTKVTLKSESLDTKMEEAILRVSTELFKPNCLGVKYKGLFYTTKNKILMPVSDFERNCPLPTPFLYRIEISEWLSGGEYILGYNLSEGKCTERKYVLSVSDRPAWLKVKLCSGLLETVTSNILYSCRRAKEMRGEFSYDLTLNFYHRIELSENKVCMDYLGKKICNAIYCDVPIKIKKPVFEGKDTMLIKFDGEKLIIE